MAGVKYEEHIYFPDGNIYVLMDDEWGVSVSGEDGIGGDLVGIVSWDFNTREAWSEWGKTVIDHIKDVKNKYDSGSITLDKVTDLVYDIENRLPNHIYTALKMIA